MYLILSIFLTIILGGVLLMMGPVAGGLLAFAIITGTLFRGLYLLNDIHRRIIKDIPKPDPVKESYENYLKENEAKAQG